MNIHRLGISHKPIPNGELIGDLSIEDATLSLAMACWVGSRYPLPPKRIKLMVAEITFVSFKGQPKQQHFEQAIAMDALQIGFTARWTRNSVGRVPYWGRGNNC